MSTTSTSDQQVVHPLPRGRQQLVSHFGGVLEANKPAVNGRFADGAGSGPLFYWSASRFSDEFRFGLHPHEGFEIMTVILEGSNFHFDTGTGGWTELAAGDVQIIAAGSGLSHDERVAGGSRAFQIWFDPGFADALGRPPTYRDTPASAFAWVTNGALATMAIASGAGPVVPTTPGVVARRHRLGAGATASLPRANGELTVVYVVGGSGEVAGEPVSTDDVVRVTGPGPVTAHATEPLDLFLLGVPEHPAYTPVAG